MQLMLPREPNKELADLAFPMVLTVISSMVHRAKGNVKLFPPSSDDSKAVTSSNGGSLSAAVIASKAKFN